jgi:hypothetical protein
MVVPKLSRRYQFGATECLRRNAHLCLHSFVAVGELTTPHLY